MLRHRQKRCKFTETRSTLYCYKAVIRLTVFLRATTSCYPKLTLARGIGNSFVCSVRPMRPVREIQNRTYKFSVRCLNQFCYSLLASQNHYSEPFRPMCTTLVAVNRPVVKSDAVETSRTKAEVSRILMTRSTSETT